MAIRWFVSRSQTYHAGDFYRTYGYPFVDAANGGSFKGTLEVLLQASRPYTTILPGHGMIAA